MLQVRNCLYYLGCVYEHVAMCNRTVCPPTEACDVFRVRGVGCSYEVYFMICVLLYFYEVHFTGYYIECKKIHDTKNMKFKREDVVLNFGRLGCCFIIFCLY
jgi:hypothetical protein